MIEFEITFLLQQFITIFTVAKDKSLSCSYQYNFNENLNLYSCKIHFIDKKCVTFISPHLQIKFTVDVMIMKFKKIYIN